MTAPYQLFPVLDAATESALEASIERHGVLVPIVVDQHDQIIDGHHRARLAAELDVDCPSIAIEVDDDDDAQAIAAELNLARRHLNREQRCEVIVELRRQGHSLRAIGDALGVSHEQVRQDAAGVKNLTPASVRGRDGKEYPSERSSAPAPEPDTDDELFGPGEEQAIIDELRDAHGDDVTEEDVERAIEENLDSKRDPATESKPPRKPDLGDGISHPARYSLELIPVFAELLRAYSETPGNRVLDPFAGSGRIHELYPEWNTVGVEIEPEWADLHERNIVGSALDLEFDVGSFDAIVTSPTYGNRLADSHNASDPERRRSYTHDLGRQLADDNSGDLHWRTTAIGSEASGSNEYRAFHARAWTEASRVLRTDGLFILNMKDHYREGLLQPVTAWHCHQLGRLGFRYIESRSIPTRNLRQGANGDLRSQEEIHVFRKGSR